MKSDQASVFGFPNPMLGLVAYAIVICVGMSLLGRCPLPALVLADLQRGHALRRRLLHLAAVPVAVQHQLAVPVVLPGLGRHDRHVLVRDRAQRAARLPARARLAEGLPRRVPWVLPVLHIGIIGMLILTRWWDFWTS